MPYKSKAQQRLFHVNPELKKHARKWDEETKSTRKGFKGLPEKVKKKKPRKRKKITLKRISKPKGKKK